MTLKAVLFDLDETLIRRDTAIRRFVAAQYTKFAAELAPITAERFAERYLLLEDNGRIDKKIFYPSLIQDLGVTGVSSEALLADYRANYPNYATTNPGALDTLRALKAHGLKLGILTNGNGVVQNGKIDAIGIRPLLDAIVISELAGLKKPDPAIFHLAAKQLGVAPAECTFVGDNPTVDIVGALAAGMGAIWFSSGDPWPPNTPPAPVTITTLPECLPLCGVPAG